MKYFSLVLFFLIAVFPTFSQERDFEWANECGNPPNTTDAASTLAQGPDGEFFLAGEFLETAQFGEKSIVSAGGTDIFLVKYNEEGTTLWTVRIGGSDFEYAGKILAGDDGSVIVTGVFYGSTIIGTDEYTSNGSQDIFIAKYDPDGNFLWSQRAGGPNADYISGLVADAGQNITIAGQFYQEILFGDTVLTSSASSDIYLAKYNAGGDLQWVLSDGGSSSDQVHSVASDNEGNILVAGSFYYNISLGDTVLTTENPSGVFIAKYGQNGMLDKAFQLDGTGLTTENFLAADQNGNFYLSGNFSGQIIFGNKTIKAGEFNQDIFIAKYNASCDLEWAKHAFSYGSDQVVGLTTDGSGKLYLTGHYLADIYFDLITLPYTLCCGSREIFVVSYDESGDALWGEQITGTRANIQSVAFNQQNELILAGLYTEQVIMGHLTLTHTEGFLNYLTCLRTSTITYVNPVGNPVDLNIYPNPAAESIHVFIQPGQRADYTLISAEGGLVHSGSFESSHTLDVGMLAPGKYVLRLNYKELSRSMSRIIIIN